MKKTRISQKSQMSFQQMQIAKYLQKLKFKPRLFGVDQADVWKKIGELNALYETALLAERARYDARIEELTGSPPGPDFRGPRDEAMYDESGNY